MSDFTDGGRAFPQYAGRGMPGCGVYYDMSGGMSLRDWFATHAPEPSNEELIEAFYDFPVFDNSVLVGGFPCEGIEDAQRAAQRNWLRKAQILWRWQYADAMLEARK